MFALSTPRLLLRDLMEADWTAVHALSQEPSITRYQTLLRLATEATAKRWVQDAIHHNSLEPRRAYNLAVVRAESGDTIGWLGWGKSEDPTQGDYSFGYALLPAAWGRGYMTEALNEALAFMFESLRAGRIYGECASSNRASARVMERLGMTCVARWQSADATDKTDKHEEHRRYTIEYADWVSFHRLTS